MNTIRDIQRYLNERSGIKNEDDDQKDDQHQEQYVPSNGTTPLNGELKDGALHIDTEGSVKTKTEKKVHKAKFISFSPSKTTLAPATP